MSAATLFGWPIHGEALSRSDSFRVLGVPSDHGNGVSRGAALAPAAIRRASHGLATRRQVGCDGGDVLVPAGLSVGSLVERVYEAVTGCLDDGHRPLLIGGDHSLTFAPIDALQQRHPMGVVWFDAHTDFSPWQGTRGHSHKQVLRRVEALPGVQRIVQVGYRGFTADDETCLGSKAHVIPAVEAATMHLPALLRLMDAQLPWYVSVDIDVVEPFEAPGTSAPVPGGLTPARLIELVTAIARHRRVCGADVVEVNPRLDVGGMTSAIAATVLHAVADTAEHSSARA
ncbi:arginase family protein [Luteibacter aegosomaticola]|uniref:arginase family protein n=1 Tax=Luteibacter aegosomaticola TaxID=2911538 RepID=UPI001FF82E45|nr:arginase family protein [Luteibacter aegosomaticola]UPG89733.1 arginase family protein [Luteibacter aegosomaticola]